MGIEFNTWRLHVGLSAPIQLNKKHSVPFGNSVSNDSFQNNSVERFYDEQMIKSMITKNPSIKGILDKNSLPIRLNMNELLALKQGHCKDCTEICAKIYKALPSALKNGVNIKDLKDGAMLHDFGKVLIPAEILNKQGRLTEEEYKTMKLHSELGYELLKNSGLNEEVLSLIRHHHDNVENKNFVPDLNIQILNLADKYSALTENRVYKKALTPKQALTVIYGDVKNGRVHPFLFKALVRAVLNTEQTLPEELKIIT